MMTLVYLSSDRRIHAVVLLFSSESPVLKPALHPMKYQDDTPILKLVKNIMKTEIAHKPGEILQSSPRKKIEK